MTSGSQEQRALPTSHKLQKKESIFPAYLSNSACPLLATNKKVPQPGTPVTLLLDACPKHLSPIFSWKPVKVDLPFVSLDLSMAHHSLHVLNGNSFSAIPK